MLRSSVLIVEYSLQRKKKWSVVFVSRPHFHVGSTVTLKPCLNLCSFKWLKFSLRRVSRHLWCRILQKLLSSLDLIKQNYFFKFIYWYYISNFFIQCTPFLNRTWIKRRIKKFWFFQKESSSCFDMLTSFGTLHYYNDLNMTVWGQESIYNFMEEKNLTRPSSICQRF